MRLRGMIGALALLAAGPAAGETTLEAALKAQLTEDGTWRQIYQAATGYAPGEGSSLKGVTFQGTAVALPIRLELPEQPPQPTVLQDARLMNCSNKEQTAIFSVDKSTTESSTLTWSNEVTIGVEVKWETGLPLIGGAETTGSVEYSREWGGSQTYTETLKWGVEVPVALDPMTIQPMQFVVEEVSYRSVPFSMDILYRGDIKTRQSVPEGAQHYAVKSRQSKKCLDLSRKDKKGGQRQVVIYDCHYGANQLWKRNGDQLVSKDNNRCLDIYKARTKRGAELITYACGNRWNQKFKSISANRLQSGDKCLDVKRAKTKNDTPVIMWGCHGGTNQKWDFVPHGDPIMIDKDATARLEGYYPDDAERVLTITGTVDVASGIKGDVFWGPTEPATPELCAAKGEVPGDSYTAAPSESDGPAEALYTLTRDADALATTLTLPQPLQQLEVLPLVD